MRKAATGAPLERQKEFINQRDSLNAQGEILGFSNSYFLSKCFNSSTTCQTTINQKIPLYLTDTATKKAIQNLVNIDVMVTLKTSLTEFLNGQWMCQNLLVYF